MGGLPGLSAIQNLKSKILLDSPCFLLYTAFCPISQEKERTRWFDQSLFVVKIIPSLLVVRLLTIEDCFCLSNATVHFCIVAFFIGLA